MCVKEREKGNRMVRVVDSFSFELKGNEGKKKKETCFLFLSVPS